MPATPTPWRRPRPRRDLLITALLALLAPLGATAQLVTPKTVPVHQGEQFQIYPSSLPGMGGVSIALNDTLFDPFVNPAKGARILGGTLFSVPSAHGITDGRGGGRTFPVGGVGAAGAWSFAGVLALQQLDRAGPVWNRPTSQRTATNRYLSGVLARRFADGLSAGVGVFNAELGAIDGVDLLYGGSDRIEQDGSVSDYRLGLVKEWDGARTLELLLVHNRTSMVHDVHFPEQRRWDPVTRTVIGVEPERSEHNVDRTHRWGAHAQFVRPVGTEGWRLGWLATVNRLSHPKIPNYVIMNIPRDPGTTYGLNLGVGAGRAAGPVTVGVDFVYEPMWSETWADAASDTAAVGGRVIRAGEKTVENTFRFSNAKLRIGAGREFPLAGDSASRIGVQFGFGVYSIDYRLWQTNHVTGTSREQRENWMEWTPTFALRVRGHGLELAYSTRLTCGVGGCDLPVPFPFAMEETIVFAPGSGGIIAAPSSPLFFDGGSVWSHRLTFAVPIR